jgi:thiamine transport system substrate-binding protein
MKKNLSLFLIIFLVIVASLFIWNQQYHLKLIGMENEQDLKVLTYSGFLKSWGPGPQIAAEFEKKYHTKIKWIEVSNAGMILENLQHLDEKDMPDVVLGLDLLSLKEARSSIKWKKVKKSIGGFTSELPAGLRFPDFVPLDWAPLTFIFRRGKLPTPTHLDDLLKESYANALALQDPRTSSTGLYFLIWVLAVKGEDAGFEFLKNLKPSIRIISPSWSTAYSLFRNNQAPMVFSFFTSTIYHYVNENDSRYQPVYFDDPHIYSVEYAGVPEACTNCERAEEFVQFMTTAPMQKLIMEKNYMLPVVQSVRKDTPFDFPKPVKLITKESYEKILEKKDEYLERWKKLNL